MVCKLIFGGVYNNFYFVVHRTSFNLTFNSSNDKWMMVNTELYLYLDEETFPNATDAGTTITYDVVVEWPPRSLHAYYEILPQSGVTLFSDSS